MVPVFQKGTEPFRRCSEKNKSRPAFAAADKVKAGAGYAASFVTSERAGSFRLGSTIFIACQS
jgi:hypothetical protein